MMGNGLGRMVISRKSGKERFHDGETRTDFDLLDFWQWSASDLIGNTAGGFLRSIWLQRLSAFPPLEVGKHGLRGISQRLRG